MSEFGGEMDENMFLENHQSLMLLLPRTNQSLRITITSGRLHVIACGKFKYHDPNTFAARSARTYDSDFRPEPQNCIMDRHSIFERILLKDHILVGYNQLFANISCRSTDDTMMQCFCL
jgi:hypothetical protein